MLSFLSLFKFSGPKTESIIITLEKTRLLKSKETLAENISSPLAFIPTRNV